MHLAEVLHSLGLARARRALGASAAVQRQCGGQGDVAAIRQRCDGKAAAVACGAREQSKKAHERKRSGSVTKVLETIVKLGGRLLDNEPAKLALWPSGRRDDEGADAATAV